MPTKSLAIHACLIISAAVLALPLLGLAHAPPTFVDVPGYFPAQPDNQPIGPAHGGVAVDRAGNVYVSTDTPRGILVFAPDGKFVRSFGPSFVHGLFLQRERGGEYLYCARPNYNEVEKIGLDGAVVWKLGYPEKSNIYAKADEFHPTNVVATPDGTIFVADGYGKKWIHKYDADRNYIKSFGGPGSVTPAEEGKFNTCHGLTVDTRGPKPMLFVCNRESGRVEYWDTDGNFVKVIQRDLRMPAAVQIRGNYVAIAELQGRVTVLGKDNEIVAQLGDNPDPKQRANYGLEPSAWTEGIFNSPHGISFDRSGSIIVSEWSQYGRLSKFEFKR
jgi:DNA-binding beta-propeller fold protein YncE